MSETTGDRVRSYLLARGFVEKSAGEYRGNCPWRAGADSKSFAVKIAPDGEHGTYIDPPANDSGSLWQLAEKLGIERPTTAPAAQTKRGYSGLADYAETHGAPASAYVEAKWVETTYQGRPALQFPTAGGDRWRFLDGQKGKPPFIHEPGYEPCWYGLKTAVKAAKSANMPLVLCNGEPSVVSAQFWGVPAACVTSSGERPLSAKHLAELREKWGANRIIIALDCDDKGRAAAPKLAQQLQDAEFPTAIVDMKLSDGGDLADFCKLYQRDAMTELANRAAFTVPSADQRRLAAIEALAPQLANVSQALRVASLRDKPVQKMLTDLQVQLDQAKLGVVGNLVIEGGAVADALAIKVTEYRLNKGKMIGLPMAIQSFDRLTRGVRHGINIILGAPGAGKSTLMASWAGNLIRMGYRGLVLTTEMNPDDWSLRLLAYLCGTTTTVIEDGDMPDTPEYNDRLTTALNLIERNLEYMEQGVSTVEMLGKAVEDKRAQGNYDFVLVDSINDIVGASENVSMAYGASLTDLNLLAQRIKLPFLCTAHMTRNVSNRADKRPTMDDMFGGISGPKSAVGFFALYNHNWYVKRDMADADARWPEGTAELACLKFRSRGQIEGERINLRFVGGSGFYDLERKGY